MSSFRISDSLSRGLPNGRKPAATTEPVGVITTEINLDRLIGIVRLRVDAAGDEDVPIRGNARDVLRRWKKRRGWKAFHE
jgi:hypothetical protein